MRMTRHNGRSGKNGVYNPKHNDRRFDIGNSEHIDPERSKKNVYWDIFNGYRTFDHMEPETELADTFDEVEQLYYEHDYVVLSAAFLYFCKAVRPVMGIEKQI